MSNRLRLRARLGDGRRIVGDRDDRDDRDANCSQSVEIEDPSSRLPVAVNCQFECH